MAKITGADIVTYDYPGRGGTTLARKADALIAFGPALVDALRARAWIGAGPLYSYGFSFGGSQAAGIARAGGFSGMILESTTDDVLAVAHNTIPAWISPFLRLQVGADLQRFDFLHYAVQARAPILVLAGRGDRQVDEKTARRFVGRLRAAGAPVTLVLTEGDHGNAPYTDTGAGTIAGFVGRGGGR